MKSTQIHSAQKLTFGIVILALLGIFACAGEPGGEHEIDESDAGYTNDVSGDAVDGGPPEDTREEPEEDATQRQLPDGWAECDCPDPEEACVGGRCGRPDIDCDDAPEACPDGFSCQDLWHDGQTVSGCLCDGDRQECSPDCERNDDCPGDNFVCFPHDYCRPSRYCVIPSDCPDGYFCAGGDCDRTGDLEVGDPCDDWMECQSGICDDGVCSEQCFFDSDCPDGEYCARMATTKDDGCRSHTCNVSCPPDERCSGDYCHPQACNLNEDCKEGDCVESEYRGLAPSICVVPEDPDIDNYCKPNEFRHWWGLNCVLPGTCWDDDDCPQPYSCNVNRCIRPATLESS